MFGLVLLAAIIVVRMCTSHRPGYFSHTYKIGSCAVPGKARGVRPVRHEPRQVPSVHGRQWLARARRGG